MKKLKFLNWLLGVAALVCVFALPSSATTTVTGTIRNLGTGTSGSNTFVRFYLRGCGGNQPRVNGTAVIAPTSGGVFYFDFVASSMGAISGTLYSTRDSTGLLAGQIQCGTSNTAVWYGMQVFVAGKGGPEIAVHAQNGVTLDISTVTPLTASNLPLPPRMIGLLASAPLPCSDGQVYFATDAAAGSNLYVCISNAWVLGSGATGATGPTGPTAAGCEIAIGDPGSSSPTIADDNDSPAVCGNLTGADLHITAVACRADAGSPTITPILTGGSGTSILTGALTCGAGSWAAGTVNGTPTIHSFSANGATCSSTPCTLDMNITTAGGAAKYIVVHITRAP